MPSLYFRVKVFIAVFYLRVFIILSPDPDLSEVEESIYQHGKDNSIQNVSPEK